MKIDSIEFVKTVRKIAAENPDKVYKPIPRDPHDPTEGTMCVYVEPDEYGSLVGSCLLGRALVELGVPTIDLRRLADFHELNLILDLGLPPEVANWATSAQRRQDQQYTWGDAIERANELHSLPAEYGE